MKNRSANTRFCRVGRAGGLGGYMGMSRNNDRVGGHAALEAQAEEARPYIRVCESAEMGVEPGQRAFDYVAAVFGAGKHVAFVFIHDELRFDAQRF